MLQKASEESQMDLTGCGALSCWGQQVGFLPSRDDAFYNEEVKKIIMEINS